MGDGKSAGASAGGAKQVRRALMFELDHVATKGRELKLEVLRSVLKGARVDVSDVLYARYCLDAPLAYGLSSLFKALGKGAVPEELADKLKGALDSAFRDSTLKLDSSCEAAVKAALKLEARVGAVSNLDPAIAEVLARTLGLTDMGVVLTSACRGHGRAFGAEHWMPLARRLEVGPPRCVVICTNVASFRAALMTRMRCIVKIDHFNGYQDFTGADVISEKLESAHVIRLLGGDGR